MIIITTELVQILAEQHFRMVSATVPGIYSIYIENPSGARRLVKSANAAYWNVANLGSSEGTISTTATPEKWNFLPLSRDTGVGGYKIVLTYTASTAKTMDASDSVGIIPVIVNGAAQTIGLNGGGGGGLGNDNFSSVLAAADVAYVANVETPVAIIRANEGVQFKVGGDKVFLSFEDNA